MIPNGTQTTLREPLPYEFGTFITFILHMSNLASGGQGMVQGHIAGTGQSR